MALGDLLRVIVPVDIRQSPAADPIGGIPQPEETIISIDASRIVRHSLQASATRNPVEQGSDITDHVILEPATLTVDGVITDSPIEFFSVISAGLGSIADLAGQSSRSKQNYDLLQILYTERIPFSVNTQLKYYPNMVITSLDVPQDAETGKSINFTIQFQQIRIVDTAQGGTVPGAGSGLPDGGANTARLSTLTTIASAAALAVVAGALFGSP